MDLEFFNSSSSSSSSDSEFLFDSDDEAYFEDRTRPKNQNYFETVARYNDLEFLEHFRVRRHIANNLTIHFEASPEFNDTTGGHGKIPAYNQMQAVCDHRNKIRSVFIGFPGSVLDARVFRRSPLATNLGILCQENVILGYSAYPCLRNLITPFKDNGRLSSQQINFNKTLSSCRYVIEHCFGLLNQKFRQLYHCKLRKIEHIVHFIRACCVLHNLAIDDEFQIIIENEDEINNGDDIQLDDDNAEDVPEGATYRNYLMQKMFP